jgi:exocyst complex protein 7
MAVASAPNRHTADEEARAEVDVLNSRLEKTSQLTKKIQVCLGRLETTGKSVREVAKPLNGETTRLQTLGRNIDAVLAAIERLRQPADSKNDEEQVICNGPDQAGLSSYLASIKRLGKSLADMQTSNLRANQQAMADLSRLIKTGNTQLESHFEALLRDETPPSVEPLHYITKDKPFPILSQETITRLGLVNAHISAVHRQSDDVAAPTTADSPVAKRYAEIRGPYLSSTLANLAAASVNTAKKKDPNAIYRTGTNGIGMYVKAMEGLFFAEYDNICSIFTREDWAPLFQLACQPALAELARTLRELNGHIRANLSTDCCLAYEITEMLTNLSNNLDARTGELKPAFGAALRPVRETAKTSLSEVFDDIKRKVGNIQAIPSDGAPVPIVAETLQRLQVMVEFIRPISSILVSLGDGGWKSSAAATSRPSDAAPSLASFDVGADGTEIFVHYCTDTLETLLASLEQKARSLLKGKSVLGVFLANCVAIMERSVQGSDLGPLLENRLPALDQWRKRATSLYTDACRDVSGHLLDAIHTNRSQRPTSGQTDSASILKGLGSKDKENIKAKFQSFNASFDELIAKHKSYHMEREVRQTFARDMQQFLEPLYNRFWDRYHEIDKGKGKYVKYDKAAISAIFSTLY